MVDFRLSDHLWRGAPMMELWRDGKFIGAIYPTDDGVKLVTKHHVQQIGPLVDAAGLRVIEVAIQEAGSQGLAT